MTDINIIRFKTNPLMSFYQLLRRYQIISKGSELEDFLTEMKPLSDCCFDFENLTGSQFRIINTIEKAIDSGSIQNIDQLITVIQKSGIKKDLDPQKVQQSYAAYLTFWENNSGIIQRNQEEIKKIYTNPQLNNHVRQIHKFFDLDSSVNTYLHPFPVENKDASGYATQQNVVHFNFYTQRTEDDKNYLGQSTLLKRRISTPLHEAVHAVFSASLIYMQMFANKGPSSHGMKNFAKFQKYIDNSLKAQGKTDRKYSAHNILHEAFASTLGSVFFQKDNPHFNPKTFEFYYGYPEADNLARIIYPITQDYIQQGKVLDDQFFQKVIQDPSFQKHFILPSLRTDFMLKKNSFCK